jgi:hypothetical protein
LVDDLLAGASLDQSIKQLPARHRIGMREFSAYSTASDQAVGVADDQVLARDGIAAVLQTQPDIEVVAQVGDGRDAVRMARRLSPNMALLDIRMPLMDGIQATGEIVGPATAIDEARSPRPDSGGHLRLRVRADLTGDRPNGLFALSD